MVSHRLAEQENTLILCLDFTSDIWPSINGHGLAPALIFLKSSFAKLTTPSSLQGSTGKGNKEKEQGNQNILTASPEGLAEHGCTLLTPGNTQTGMGIGRLPRYQQRSSLS